MVSMHAVPDAEVDPDGVGVEPGVAPGSVVVHAVDAAELVHRAVDEGGNGVLAAHVAARPTACPRPWDLLGHSRRALRSTRHR